MMLEKKTGEEIWDEIESVDGRDSLCNKVWVSQESLINKWFDFRDKVENARILTPETYKLFDDFQKELKGEK